MKRKLVICAMVCSILLAMAVNAYALPKPRTAHYPRGGMLTLSPGNEKNNTYAFRADGRADTKAQLQILGGYTDGGETMVTIQAFVVNKWGNWIAFGTPKTVALSAESLTETLTFPIRAKKAFCFVVSAYGATGECVIPYLVTTR